MKPIMLFYCESGFQDFWFLGTAIFEKVENLSNLMQLNVPTYLNTYDKFGEIPMFLNTLGKFILG